MTDLEIIRRCAEAMGWKHLGAVGVPPPERGEPDPVKPWCRSGGNDWWIDPEGRNVCAPCSGIPDPLHDDAQAMALVKKFELLLGKREPALNFGNDVWGVRGPSGVGAQNIDLNRAICLCVAKMGAAK